MCVCVEGGGEGGGSREMGQASVGEDTQNRNFVTKHCQAVYIALSPPVIYRWLEIADRTCPAFLALLDYKQSLCCGVGVHPSDGP